MPARAGGAAGAPAAGGSSATKVPRPTIETMNPAALQLLVRAHDRVAVRVELTGQRAGRRQPEAGREGAGADAVDHLIEDLPVERLAVLKHPV